MTAETAARAAAVCSGLLGALLVIAAALGPLMSGIVRFHLSEDALIQYVGGEIVTLVLAVVLLVAVPAWWTGAPWAAAVSAGGCAYVVYTMATVVAGQDYDRYPGNAEKAFLLYAAITATAVVLLVLAARLLVESGGRGAVPRQATAWLLLGLGIVFALIWIGQAVGHYRQGPSQEYESATALFWLVKYLDLGVVIPLLVMIGIGQRVGSSVVDAAAVAALGFMAWMLAALVAMAVEMVRRGAPGGSWVLVGAFLVLLAPTALVLSRWLMELLHPKLPS